jgi:hypothetical protein
MCSPMNAAVMSPMPSRCSSLRPLNRMAQVESPLESKNSGPKRSSISAASSC